MSPNPKHPAWLTRLAPLVGLAIFGVAMWALHREMAHFHWKDLVASLSSTGPEHVMLAMLMAVLSYAAMYGVNRVALRYAEKTVPRGEGILHTFISSAIALNVGVVGGGAARARLFGRAKFTGAEMARFLGLYTLLSFLGLCTYAGLLFTFRTPPVTEGVLLPPWAIRFLGVGMLTLVGGAILVSVKRGEIRLRNWQFSPPQPRILGAGVGFGFLDFLAASLTCAVLLPGAPDFGLMDKLMLIALAQCATAVSHVPGGLGVFEFVLVSGYPDSVADHDILGAVIIYRFIYLLLPFVVALVLMVWVEFRERVQGALAEFPLAAAWKHSWNWLATTGLSAAVFLSGLVLLLSSSTPALPDRVQWLREILPLEIMETSHFLSSLAGLFLMVLALSIQKRVNAAWWAVTGLLVAGIVFSLLKGWDFEEAAFLTLVLALLIPARKQFFREAALLTSSFSAGWWTLVFVAITGSIWVGFIAYRDVRYHDDLWWRFAYFSDAPRFLRASAGIAVVFVAVTLYQLLAPGLRKDLRQPQPVEGSIVDIIQSSPHSEANLAWLGDKRFLINPAQNALLMYGVYGRSLITLGDPIGPEKEWEDLLWRFREECHRLGARPVCYSLSEAHVHLYVDIGLQVFKVGKEARVSLPDFTLEGPARRDLRHVVSKMQRTGHSYEVIPPSQAEAVFPRLREISDAWLRVKNVREKSFSLGSFREDYLRHFPLAVVKKEDRVIAFANLMTGAGKAEITIDLMRYEPDESPNGLMHYLFTEIMRWGQQEGYQWFSLGVAPLSGLESRALSPLWHRIGHTVFRYGEHFYNFQGLRGYKEKFDPVWSSSYLATSGLHDLVPAMIDCSALVSGGLSGLIRK